MPTSFDFSIYADASVALITPLTSQANTWVTTYLRDSVSYRYGDSIPCELRYIREICIGIIRGGLTITKDNMRMLINEDGELVLTKISDTLVSA
jgi:hypothetical protein